MMREAPYTVEFGAHNCCVARVGRRVIGRASAWHDADGRFVMLEVVVRESYRRRGVATAMYRKIEEAAGKPLAPADSLSKDAFEFWKRYRPEAVAHDLRHRQAELEGAKVAAQGGRLATITVVGQHNVTARYDDATHRANSETVISAHKLQDALARAGAVARSLAALPLEDTKSPDHQAMNPIALRTEKSEKEALKTTLLVCGSYETVAETAMYLWRRLEDFVHEVLPFHDPLSVMSSRGIRQLNPADPSFYSLEVTCLPINKTAGGLCEETSRLYPSVLVGCSVVGTGLYGIPGTHCWWGGVGYIGGSEVVHFTGTSPRMLPGEIERLIDSSAGDGAFPVAAIPQLESYSRRTLLQEAAARVPEACAERSAAKAISGFPRWSLLTHAVNSQGIGGISIGLRACAGATNDGEALVKAVAEARAGGVASWVDTLFFGSRTPVAADEGRPGRPFSDEDALSWAARWRGVLQNIGRPESGDRVADALAHALSSPLVTFQDGSHPVAWLAQVRFPPEDKDMALGFRRLLKEVTASAAMNGLQQREALLAAGFSGCAPQVVRTAIAFCKSPGRVASALMPLSNSSDALKLQRGAQLLNAFGEIYGSLRDFPEELQRAFQDAPPVIAAAYQAKCAEESMRDVIADYSHSHLRPIADAPATAKHRNRVV